MRKQAGDKAMSLWKLVVRAWAAAVQVCWPQIIAAHK